MIWLLKATNDGGMDFGSEINRARLKQHLKEHVGRTYRLEFPEQKRTLSQNAYYWLYMEVIARETGDDAESLHEFFKRKFAPRKHGKARGLAVEYAKSTRDMTKLEFGDYLDRISAETEIALPSPEEAGYLPH